MSDDERAASPVGRPRRFLKSKTSRTMALGAVGAGAMAFFVLGINAVTNQSDDSEREKALQLGADRYIVKASMIPSEVVSAVAEELAKKKASKS